MGDGAAHDLAEQHGLALVDTAGVRLLLHRRAHPLHTDAAPPVQRQVDLPRHPRGQGRPGGLEAGTVAQKTMFCT